MAVIAVASISHHARPLPRDCSNLDRIPCTTTNPKTLDLHSFQRPSRTHLSTASSSKKSHPLLIKGTMTNSCNETFLTLLHWSFNSDTYASLIESCKCLSFGRQIHAHTLKTGLHGHEFLETKLLLMYGRFKSMEDADDVFDKMQRRNIYSWTAILTVYADNGYYEKGLELFRVIQDEGIGLEFFIFPVVFKICGGLSALKQGRELHGFVMKRQFVSNVYVGNALIDMYGKCGCLGDAHQVFVKMPQRDIVSWNCMLTGCAANGMVFEALGFLEDMKLTGLRPNLVSWSAMIGGFAQNGYDREALDMLRQLQENGIKPNPRTIASVLPACASLQILGIGKQIHGYVTRQEFMSNSFVVNGLLDVYRKCADMESARCVFMKFSTRNLVSFNTMIVGYCENGEVIKAKELFYHIELVGIKRDTISWNSLISGYAHNGEFDEALKMFRNMQMEGVESDSFTLGSILTVCADLASFKHGKEIHSFAIARKLQTNCFVGGALVQMYCRCQDLVSAKRAFDEIIERDTASWNAMIAGYAHCNQMENAHKLLDKMKSAGLDPNIYTWNGIVTGYVENGHFESALQLFSEIHTLNLKPDIYTIGIILPACSRLATVEQGKQVHAHSIRCGYDIDVHIGAAIIDMYDKCGSIRYARLAFNRIKEHDLVSWNTMLAGYAMHGQGKEGIALFNQMQADGIKPDGVSFLSVLSSCAHAGLVDEGWVHFNLMANYSIEPMLKHYTCMVDLLSRAAMLFEAYNLIKRMPMVPDAVTWGSLLSGCVIHGNVELGEIAAHKLIELEGDNTGNYVLLANLYASTGRWDDLARTRQIIKARGMQKSPGCSWIEVRDRIHVFLASDRSHQETADIYATLDTLTFCMRREGYKSSMEELQHGFLPD